MKQPKIISSPLDRVQKTLKAAYQLSTDKEVEIAQVFTYENQKGEQKQKIKSNTYPNLLGYDSLHERTIGKEFEEKCAQVDSSIPSLQAQDMVTIEFLKGNFESGTPYLISKARLKLLLKGFDNLDTQDEVKILGMRHGHKKGKDLTPQGIQEAQDAGKAFEFGSQDLVFGTHQTIIESLLTSLVGGSQGLSPQEARDALPSAWQQPYKTAQVTEFDFFKSRRGKKLLAITTNNHMEIFSEDDCRRAYMFVSK